MSTIYQINDMAAVSSKAPSDVVPATDTASTTPKRYTVGQLSSILVDCTASTLTVTAAAHAGAVVTLNRAAGIAVTLPAAAGTGYRYRFVIGTTVTSNSTTIKVANASDAMQGFSNVISDDAGGPAKGFIVAAGTDDTITFNGTTTGGYVGDMVEVIDVATNRFQVSVFGKATGTEATPFSATV